MEIDDLTGAIVDVALGMHKELGPGLLESVYQAVMAGELVERGLSVEQNRTVPFEFRGRTYDKGLRVDLLVDGLVVVELKSVETLAAVHWKQVLTYIRLLNLPVGLLINFGAATLKEGLKRVVNNYQDPASLPSASPRLRVSHWDSYRKGAR